jgi:hypothetical protein
MSATFVNKFLELAEPLPRKLIRHLKLLKEVERISYNLNQSLKERREQYLEKLREKSLKRSITLKSIKSLYKEVLSLSDYKLELIKEIKYILENEFVEKLNPIIEEGKTELESNNKKITFEDTSSITTDTEANSKKFLNKKKNRSVKKSKEREKEKEKEKEKENIHIENNIHNHKIRDLKDVYCKCKRESYGKMIQCDNPDCGEWFHYECIGLKENYEPKEEWFCSDKCRLKAKRRFK